MKCVNVTNLRKNIYDYLDQTICYNQPINVTTKNGNVVIMSEEDYNNLMETLKFSSISGLKEDVIEGMKEPIEDCVREDEIEW